MISGIRRRKIAEESSGTFFQTTKLITSHFRRDADKEKIYEITDIKSTLKDLLIASSVVHIYHYLGIHTIDTLESGNISVEHIGNLEKMEKMDLFNEIVHIINDSIEHEVDLLSNENLLLKQLIEKVSEHRDEISNDEFEELREDLEDNFTEILQKYPYVYFFDYVGNLLGYVDDAKSEIIERSSQLKIISREIEKELIEGGREDNYLELSTIKQVIDRMMKDFEFESKKDLQMETVPIRMITTKVLNHLFDLFPTSPRGIDNWLDAISFISGIIEKFRHGIHNKTDYGQFETEILNMIKDKILDICTSKTSNDLVYFLEFVSDCQFHEIIDMFNRFGVISIPEFADLFRVDLKKFNNILTMYGISKMDIVKISNPKNNLLAQAESVLLEMKEKNIDLQDSTINTLLRSADKHQNILSEICVQINTTLDELRKFNKKIDILNEKIVHPMKLTNIYSMILLTDHQKILDNIAREIFFIIFAKITRQTSRILESYIKTKEDVGIYLLGLKRIYSVNGKDDEWVSIKIEELMIERLMTRQKELSMIFNAERQPFLVNGFILARLLDTKLEQAINILNNEPSALYYNVKPLTLPKDIVSSVSYCLSLDLLERYKQKEEKRFLHVESATIKEEEKTKEKRQEIRKAQEEHTFNWIERKISSSIMRITSKGINPTTLYWSEKDNQTCSDNIKLHSMKDSNTLQLMVEFYQFALDRMKQDWPKTKIPEKEKIIEEVKEILSEIMASRLKRSSAEITELEINENIIEGEIITASEKLASVIGKRLDKILYKKFKTALK